MTTRGAVDLEAQLALALERIDDLGRQLARSREEAAERDATLRALRESWATVEGRTLRHEASLDAVRALGASVSALGERIDEESRLRRDALASLGQGVARDRDAAGAVVEQLGHLEERLETTTRATAGAGARGRTQGDALLDVDARLERAGERLDAIEGRLAAERAAVTATASGQAALEARSAELTAALKDLAVRLRDTQTEGRALAAAVAALQTSGDRDAELRELLEQQRSTRQRLEERLMALDDEMRRAGEALLVAAEQRAQLRVQAHALDQRLHVLEAGQATERELLSARFRALAELEERAGHREAQELERQARERRELLSRLDETLEQATREVPL
ncbi:MAG: hypothetical protein U0360_10955 [Dehalococcoidia bacterium]